MAINPSLDQAGGRFACAVALLIAPALLGLGLLAAVGPASAAEPPPRNVFFGDTHLHTSYSFDAFLNGNRSADPDTAFRWARGLPVIHPYHRARVRINTPLDFLVVADHAEYLGVIRQLYFEVKDGPNLPFAQRIRAAFDGGSGADLFKGVLPTSDLPSGATRDPIGQDGATNALPIHDEEALRTTAWADSTAAADRHNDPGNFTALIGWEWSSLPNGANLHRVVITSAEGAKAREFLPYGSDKSSYPEDLWAWLDATSQETGAAFVAIPHNGNISKGYMWGATALDGTPYTAESARTRARWEPVAEVTQYKGDSEAHPRLSPEDEFADFEEYPFYIQQNKTPYVAQVGDYARSALRRGLEIEARVGVNPFKFGMIGATDSHSGLAAPEEDNFWGKMALDSTPETKSQFAGGRGVSGWNMAAGGLAGVWAEENTRASLFEAFKRREVYATTGSRIRVRLFGGWWFDAADLEAADLGSVGYAKGVPMGGDLVGAPTAQSQGLGKFFGRETKQAPHFLVQAVKDPKGANLDRVQIVKGWVDNKGQSHERIYNVAWSGNRVLGKGGTLAPVGDTIDRATGRSMAEIGGAELVQIWSDPDFDAEQRAFYYARVFEVPTPRHSLLDAIALGGTKSRVGPDVIQERAYTSPIWYTP